LLGLRHYELPPIGILRHHLTPLALHLHIHHLTPPPSPYSARPRNINLLCLASAAMASPLALHHQLTSLGLRCHHLTLLALRRHHLTPLALAPWPYSARPPPPSPDSARPPPPSPDSARPRAMALLHSPSATITLPCSATIRHGLTPLALVPWPYSRSASATICHHLTLLALAPWRYSARPRAIT